MKVIFLDVDGCLNCKNTVERFHNALFVEDRKVELLQYMVRRSGAKIVLTSTWRKGWMDAENGIDSMDRSFFEALVKKFQEYELELFSYTPDLGKVDYRGKEIHQWLQNWDEEEIDGILILDDMNGRKLHPYGEWLIRTSFSKGLLPRHVDRGVKILNVPFQKRDLKKGEGT